MGRCVIWNGSVYGEVFLLDPRGRIGVKRVGEMPFVVVEEREVVCCSVKRNIESRDKFCRIRGIVSGGEVRHLG